jgi:hypothetical protein
MTFRSRRLHRYAISSESEGLELNTRHTRSGGQESRFYLVELAQAHFGNASQMRNAANMPVTIRPSQTSIRVFGLTSAIGYETFWRMNPPQISKAAAARKGSLRYQVIKRPRKDVRRFSQNLNTGTPALGGYDRPDVGAFIDTDRSQVCPGHGPEPTRCHEKVGRAE